MILRNFLERPWHAYRHYPNPLVSPTVNDRLIQGRQTARVLFDTYSPDVEPWYVHRQEDETIWSTNSTTSLWVTGATGLGKTAFLKRFLDLTQSYYCYAILASYNKAEVIDILRHIYRKLEELIFEEDKHDISDLPSSLLIDRITSLLSTLSSRSPFQLFVEEIPYVNEGHFN